MSVCEIMAITMAWNPSGISTVQALVEETGDKTPRDMVTSIAAQVLSEDWSFSSRHGCDIQMGSSPDAVGNEMQG